MLCTGSDNSGSDGSVWFGNGGIGTGVHGDQSSTSQDVQKKLQSGSLYNERGRDELVEIGARYEDRPVNNGEKEDTVVEDRQKEGSHPGKLDFDEYDDDGGDVEVEKKAESVDNNEDARRMQRLRGAGGSVQTDAGGVEEVGVLDKPGEQNSRSTIEVQSNQDTVSADTKVQKLPRTKKKRHSASEYIISIFFKRHVYQFPQGFELGRSLQLQVNVFVRHQFLWLMLTA